MFSRRGRLAFTISIILAGIAAYGRMPLSLTEGDCVGEDGVAVAPEVNVPTYPAHWGDCCPPKDAEPAHGIVYRVVKSNPPSDADLKTHEELDTMKKADPCGRRGLSVIRDATDVRKHHSKFPGHGRYVAVLKLAAEHGAVKLEPGTVKSHTNWWVAVGVDRQARVTATAEIES